MDSNNCPTHWFTPVDFHFGVDAELGPYRWQVWDGTQAGYVSGGVADSKESAMGDAAISALTYGGTRLRCEVIETNESDPDNENGWRCYFAHLPNGWVEAEL